MGILDEWGGTGFGFCYEYGSVFWGCVCIDKDGDLDWSALGVSSGFIVIVECEWFECCEEKKRKRRDSCIIRGERKWKFSYK